MSIIDIAAPDGLRWSLLRAALAGDQERYDEIKAAIDQIERAAIASRAEHVARRARAGRLF